MVAGIPRVPVGGSDDRANRTQMANSLNSALKQLSTAQATIATLSGTLGGDLTGTLPNPTVGANKIDNTKLAQMATKTIKGNATGGTANAADLTAAQTKALLGGMLAQAPVIFETGTVATGTTLLPYDDTIPQNTEGDQYMSATITPINASSTLIIDVVAMLSSNAAQNMSVALFQDTTANALAAIEQWQNGSGFNGPIHFRHKMPAGTTSATTFKVRAGGNSAGTTTFNGQAGGRIFGGTMASSITISEILP